MTVMSQGHGANDQRAQLEALYAAMAPKGLLPLWESLHALVLAEPQS
ncbi:MAG: gentisate 1,2-dioxygenase, partial [Sphingobium sp.]